jgi:hypothetical protein
VPGQRIGQIVAGGRAITADPDLRLCRYFGLSDARQICSHTDLLLIALELAVIRR